MNKRIITLFLVFTFICSCFSVSSYAAVKLIDKTIKATCNGHTFTAKGYMPENAVLSVKELNEDFNGKLYGKVKGVFAQKSAYDIRIFYGNKEYQPIVFGKHVDISIDKIKGDVYRIESDEITEMPVKQGSKALAFTTNHFTTYVIGGTTYHSVNTGNWLGMDWATYDTNSDSKPDTLVLTGTKTGTIASASDNVLQWAVEDVRLNRIRTIIVDATIQGDCRFLFCRVGGVARISFSDNFAMHSVTGMYSMFGECPDLETLDLSKFNTNSVTSMRSLFYSCRMLEYLDLSSFNTSNTTDMMNMFYDCTRLRGITFGTKFNTSKVTNMENMFLDCVNLVALDVSNFNTSRVVYIKSMFSGCAKLRGIDVSNFDTSYVRSLDCVFKGCSSLQSLDVSGFNTSRVTEMSTLFKGCSNLTHLDVSNFDTRNVDTMANMFAGCNKLVSLDVSNFRTSKLNYTYNMFDSCYNLRSLDMSGFDTSKVSNMDDMFRNCFSLQSLDVSGFDLSRVTTMVNMFMNCRSLRTLQLPNSPAPGLKHVEGLCQNCYSLRTAGVYFSTNNVVGMENMFANCKSLTSLNLSEVSTAMVTNASKMFSGCSRLKILNLGNDFKLSNATNLRNMFKNCHSLKTLDLHNIDINTSNTTGMLDGVRAREIQTPRFIYGTVNLPSLYRIGTQSSWVRELTPSLAGKLLRRA